MTVLVLTLAGPLQAWGSESRFTTRATDDAPTKSGIVGLLAAAQGRRRSDSLEDYVGLRLGVRIDQPGRLLRDFQTARSLDGRQPMPLSYRYYREDARFLAVVHAEDSLLELFVDALRHPVFPLYLGRRSCPPAEPLVPRLLDAPLGMALRDEPWRAAPWWRRRCGDEPPMLEFRVDRGAAPELADRVDGSTVQRDEPVSFDPEHRQYGWRTVDLGSVPVPGAPAPAPSGVRLTHDPFEAVD
ncbi:type I-E CRISPR-associated protein Cas5/CasD [Cellulomonas fimi]|uniref:CRISPR-associated protein Cas5 family n=1 Tax=Cellulomonas fimi (strain ATCC 484 / DSM 20113 / JCM 1341 / CCUG 24087 / LMG 16345 / NBRC 15513 / NCIMB 8980 / NCTC 7547 / NRS-133) TaxID=590998 RepID=F4H8A2_CELFA|nr:type I-E CRISPR-associated protein Cas5/CasD [Cellulomonas fimi]AEE44659.1 CRISPR-associated protein Cas5 family [Cellulomonas fimi ATCC 484]NNH07472.1 type I-E CRISPR-associated protein Cas5/CasD [Cellulomonas fimi]VEH26919.1 CRISPR-associated protein Cas5/CasD, subtype I-E/ECOLI [Cellulomonas fimi]